MSPLWSYGLAAIGILGIWLAGQRRSVGWAVGLFAQVLWIAYAVVTNQPGFIVSALAYGAVYGRNWLRWRTSEAAPEPTSVIGPDGERVYLPVNSVGEAHERLRNLAAIYEATDDPTIHEVVAEWTRP